MDGLMVRAIDAADEEFKTWLQLQDLRYETDKLTLALCRVASRERLQIGMLHSQLKTISEMSDAAENSLALTDCINAIGIY
jgi:hypothetical protein